MPDSVGFLCSAGKESGEELTKGQVSFIRYQAALTPATAFESQQMAAVSKYHADELYEALRRAIMLTVMQFNVKDSLKPLQLELLTANLVKRFWYLKIDELFYVLKEGVAGKWKRPYNHIDGPTIIQWVNEYEETERPALLEKHIAKQRALKPETVSVPGSSEAVRLLVMGYTLHESQVTPEELQEAEKLYEATQAAETKRLADLQAKKEKHSQPKALPATERYSDPEFIARLKLEVPEKDTRTVGGLVLFFDRIKATEAAEICKAEHDRRKK